MNNLPLQPLVWFDGGNNDGDLEAHSPSHYYVITEEDEKQKVMYGKHYHVSKEATGFATIDEAKAWAWNHYNEKMQPYVKPLPTWIDASEQLPSVDVDTQFICAYYSAIDTFSKVVWFNADIGKFDYRHDDVLAWMPIPEFSTMQNLHKGE